MKTIYLARHGETTAKHKEFYGRTDIELSERGKDQSHALVEQLLAHDIELVITTGLKRTDYCGQILSDQGLPHYIEAKLQEINFGEWEGLNFDQLQAQYPQATSMWLDRPQHFRFPEGETITEFEGRVATAWHTLLQRPESTIAVICHSGVISYLLQRTQQTTTPIYLDTGSLVTLTV